MLLAVKATNSDAQYTQRVASSAEIFKSANENEDETEFSCLLIVRIRSCPYVTP